MAKNGLKNKIISLSPVGDERFIAMVEEYQKKNCIRTFTQAVRELTVKGLCIGVKS
tara:strand:- start:877 stop:1044 length:168 start_codon:yes stop_codon:yes gene_type:complete